MGSLWGILRVCRDRVNISFKGKGGEQGEGRRVLQYASEPKCIERPDTEDSDLWFYSLYSGDRGRESMGLWPLGKILGMGPYRDMVADYMAYIRDSDPPGRNIRLEGKKDGMACHSFLNQCFYYIRRNRVYVRNTYGYTLEINLDEMKTSI